MNKKKKTIIAILSALVVLAIAIAGFFYVKQQRYEQSINEKISAISNTSSGFQNAERTTKLTLLQEFQKELKEYKESENPDEKVIGKYESEIASMKAYFVEEYNKVVADNTVADVDSITDAETVNKKSTALKELKTKLNTEKDIFFDNETATTLEKKIDDILLTYTKRAEKIEADRIAAEKKAAEEKKKAEEKAAAEKAEAEKKEKLHYENEYFTIDIPESWLQQGRTWQITPIPGQYNGVMQYSLSQSDGSPYSSGGVTIYVFTEGVIPRGMIIPETKEIGTTSSGALVLKGVEASAGFLGFGTEKPVLKLK
jgi:hypothetical protein